MQAVRTYLALDLTEDPSADEHAAAAVAALDVRRAALEPAAYRALYDAVGSAYRWRDRHAWSDDALARHLGDPGTSVWVLQVDGATAGYFELVRDAARDDVLALQYFGLLPAFHGRGLGRRLLERAIAEARRLDAGTLTVDTCSLDHAAALPNYLARGFRVLRTERYEVEPGG